MPSKYFRKRDQKWVEYKYNLPKTRRSKTLMSAKGKIYKKNLDLLFNEIEGYDENINMKSELKRSVIDYIEHQQVFHKKATISGWRGFQSTNVLDRFFANAGWTVEEFANIEGLDIDKIYEAGIHNDRLVIGDRIYEFFFDYNNQIWNRIQ